MADFTADVTQMDAVCAELNALCSRADRIASSMYSIGQDLTGIKSLAGKGYPHMVYEVRSSIRTVADDTHRASLRMDDIARTYAMCERKTRALLLDTPAGSAAIDAGDVRPGSSKRSFGEAFREAVKDTYDQTASNYREFGDMVEDFHVWRSTKGSAWVEGIYARLGDDSLLKNFIEGVVEKANDKVGGLEKVVNAFTHPFDSNALGQGVSGFADMLGIGWVPNLISKYGNMVDYYEDVGGKQIASGHVLAGTATVVGGAVLTCGTMTVDACVKTAKSAVGGTHVGGLLVGSLNKLSTVFSGKSAEGHLDSFFGGIGSGVSGAFDSLVGA